MSDDVGRCIALQSVPFLHQVSSAKRSFAFISGSASFSNSKRAVMEMVGSPAAGMDKIKLKKGHRREGSESSRSLADQ